MRTFDFSAEATAVARYVDLCHRDPSAQYAHCLGTGPIAELEQRLSTIVGKRYCVVMSSATAALGALPYALQCERKEFITTPATYGATVAGWLRARCRVRFADIDPDSLTLDPASVRLRIAPRTAAILAVDLFGTPSDDDALREIADDLGVWYIVDASQALGAQRNGFHASHRADVIVTSFTAGKTVFAGEGGAVLTDRRDVYERLLFYTQHPLRQRREIGLGIDNEFGINARMHPLAAVWALAAIDRAFAELAQHRALVRRIIAALNESGLTRPIDIAEGVDPTFFRLTVARRSRTTRAALERKLADRGFRAIVEPLPLRLLYEQPAFTAQFSGQSATVRCPVAEREWKTRVCVVPPAD